MSTILITGGTGMIGTAISKLLVAKSHKVIILTRSLPGRAPRSPGIRYALWNVERESIDDQAFAEADFIIHLAGAGVADKRWTEKRKKEIVNSRVASGQLIARYLLKKPNKVKALISASAIGWYGPDPVIPNPLPFIETDPAHDSFLGNTCKEWEKSIYPVKELNKRIVYFRTGIVLSKTGGALPEFQKPLRYGFATVMGSGDQVISWIHIEDLAAMYVRAIENETMQGAYNAVAPNPVSNRQFMIELARASNRKPIFVKVPAFALKIAVGEMSVEILKSATVKSDKIENEGFIFRFPELKDALKDLSG